MDPNGWKSKRVKHYQACIHTIKQEGIRVLGAFILGFDDQTPEDFQAVKQFVLDNNIVPQYSLLTPVPGSKLYTKYKEAGRIRKDKTWKYYNFLDCVFKHPGMTAEEMETAVADLYKSTFTNEHMSRITSEMIQAEKRKRVQKLT